MKISISFCCFIALTLGFTIYEGRIASAAEISGNIVNDHGGNGISGYVEVRSGDPCNYWSYSLVASADVEAMGDSRFSIKDLPAGIYYLVGGIDMANPVTVVEYWAGAKSTPHCSDAVQMNIQEDDVLTDINFELDTGAELSGTLYDKNGKLIEGDAYLKKNACDGKTLVTGQDSKYVIRRIVEGAYYLAVQPEGNFLTEFWAGEGTTVDCKAAKPVVFDKAEIKKGFDVHLNMVKGAKITGEVKDATTNERPLSYEVTAYSGNPCGQLKRVQEGSPVEGAESNYEIIGLPPGECYLMAQGYYEIDNYRRYVTKWWTKDGGSVDCRQAETVEIASDEEIEGIDFQLEKGGKIEGYVYDSSGDTMPAWYNLRVEVYQGDPCKREELIVEDVSAYYGDGRWSFGGLPAGTYYLLSKKGGYKDRWWTSAKGTEDCRLAEPVTIGVAETLSRIDFYLDKNTNTSCSVNELLLKSSK